MVFWIATLIFLVSFGLIVSEKIDKTKVALIGAGLMIILKIVSQHEAFYDEHYAIDYNVIFLLIGMMIIVDILRKTGIFQFIAIKSAKLAQGRPFPILVFFACITAFASALLDNVTTVLLLVPVALFIAEELELDPFPFMISEVMACNIGGTATLIGDPPQYHDCQQGTAYLYGLYLSSNTRRVIRVCRIYPDYEIHLRKKRCM